MNSLTEPLRFKTLIADGVEEDAASINRSIDTLAENLEASVRTGNPFIYLLASNHPKTVTAFFAIMRAGGICVLCDPHLRDRELREYFDMVPASALINLDPTKQQWSENEIIRLHQPITLCSLEDIADVKLLYFAAAYDGYSKAIMLTEKNLIANATSISRACCVTSSHTSCSLLPLGHLYGLQSAILTPCIEGGSMLIEDISSLVHIRETVKRLRTFGIDNLCSVPAVYYLLCKVPSISSILSNVTCICGGYHLPDAVADLFSRTTGKPLLNGYGLSEASPVCSISRPHETVKKHSVGHALDCCEIQIMLDDRTVAPAFTIGEVCVRGDNVMKGYYRDKPATDAVLKNGWLHTGDRGYLDDDGTLFLCGMKKNMVKVGGKTLFPNQIRRQLQFHDNVAAVRLEIRDDPLLYQSLTAHIQLYDNSPLRQAQFSSWCKETIASFKLPKKLIFEQRD
ncbi:MAG: AMP-binding protein [Chitinivibrionales bacterium]|nr:AMP-binding protein [Chitinivibrionales bacterium]